MRTFIDGVLFKSQLSADAIANSLQAIDSARANARALKLQIKNSVGVDTKAQAINDFLQSPDAALPSAIRANKDLSKPKRASLERCFKIAGTIDVSKPLAEPVLVRAHPKKHGGFRAIHNFGLRHRTAQDMVRGVMECHFVPRPFQYTFQGLHAAISDTKQRLKSGLVYVATLDIDDHFGSFNAKKLAAALPLQKEWVDHVVLGRRLAVEVAYRPGALLTGLSPHTLLDQACRGVPLGSTCSPIVAAFCMSKLQWKTSIVVALANYADNFSLLAHSEEELKGAIGMLKVAVANLPGGSFKLKLISENHVTNGFEFLGHRLKMDSNGQLTTSPTPANLNTFWAELAKMDEIICCLIHTNQPDAALDQLKHMCGAIKGWVAAFRECDRVEEHKSCFLFIAGDTAKLLGKSIHQIYAHQDANEFCAPPTHTCRGRNK